ncbi:MAG TPA: hypothetical protein VF625_10950 [Longimicrobium sp.]|jgi:hypoxanthine phosphoribosyltransferase
MDITSIITAVTTLLSVAGVWGTVYYGRKSNKLEQRLRRFTWEDIGQGVSSLGNTAFRDFEPDLILSLSAPGAIVANLLLLATGRFVPLYLGVSRKTGMPALKGQPASSHVVITNRWIADVPDEVFRDPKRRILICEDCVVTGATLAGVVDLLQKAGYERENIRTIALFTTDLAIQSQCGPDVHWMNVSETKFYLPWGQSLGRGY